MLILLDSKRPVRIMDENGRFHRERLETGMIVFTRYAENPMMRVLTRKSARLDVFGESEDTGTRETDVVINTKDDRLGQRPGVEGNHGVSED